MRYCSFGSHHHVGALASGAQCNGKPDAAAGTSDENSFLSQAHLFILFEKSR